MNSVAFQAQRAVYFRKIDSLRLNNSIMYCHDETWLNKNEEKTVVWFDDNGYGRLRKSEGKGTDGFLSLNGFHLRSLDIFKCDEVHSMDNNHFVAWMDSAASTLRSEHGKSAKIAIIIDNATWHNKLTPESEPPKRAWMTKAELIELAFTHLSPKEYIADKIASKYDIEIVRIPVKHCVLNPIDEWLAACDPEHASGYFTYVHKHEEIFKTADKIAEELENDLIDGDDDIDNEMLNDDDETND
ncbi:unnamed protein product [Didymodactylos carnosus]|uniref:Uncharacterized protein n=1 Tax=Didymodactylos carnosus TaxID=1234261 RepID=A0A814SKU8_9BILA|nr:unnamed protein product [Didymodactylos carnosus]CAF3913299.1 unnamed protein product [Didymodactylos carnosus]